MATVWEPAPIQRVLSSIGAAHIFIGNGPRACAYSKDPELNQDAPWSKLQNHLLDADIAAATVAAADHEEDDAITQNKFHTCKWLRNTPNKDSKGKVKKNGANLIMNKEDIRERLPKIT